MKEDAQEFMDKLGKGINSFSENKKDIIAAFGNLNDVALKAGALDHKTKLLMSVAIAIATPCEYCMGGRTEAAVKAGATREELLETAAVGLLMGGSVVLGSIGTRFMDILDLFAPETAR
jgi:AhpD family alkylhydroperoxidase